MCPGNKNVLDLKLKHFVAVKQNLFPQHMFFAWLNCSQSCLNAIDSNSNSDLLLPFTVSQHSHQKMFNCFPGTFNVIEDIWYILVDRKTVSRCKPNVPKMLLGSKTVVEYIFPVKVSNTNHRECQ